LKQIKGADLATVDSIRSLFGAGRIKYGFVRGMTSTHLKFWRTDLILELLADCPLKVGQLGSIFNDFEVHITKTDGTQRVIMSTDGSPVICRVAADLGKVVQQDDDGRFMVLPPGGRLYQFIFDMTMSEHKSMYPCDASEVRRARFVELR